MSKNTDNEFYEKYSMREAPQLEREKDFYRRQAEYRYSTAEDKLLNKLCDIEDRICNIERSFVQRNEPVDLPKKKKSIAKTLIMWPIQFAAKRYILSTLLVLGLTTSGYWSLPEWENTKEVISYQMATGLLTTLESGIEKKYVNKEGEWFSYPNFEKVSDSYLSKVAESIESVGPNTRYPTKKKWWF